MQTKEIIKRMLACMLAFAFTYGVSAMEITRFVKPGGIGKGTSWADACGSINQALADIKTGGNGTVYIGQGKYEESVKIPDGCKNVRIFGGFSENNMDLNKPVLDKVFITPGKTDITRINNVTVEVGYNCDSIVIAGINVANATTGIILRGTNIWVYSCKASGCSTGISNDNFTKNVIINGCAATNCTRYGMMLSHVTVMNSNISDNGLGLNIDGCNVDNCRIYNNYHIDKATSIPRDGGGIHMTESTLSRCYIINNRCTGEGGGVHISGGGMGFNYIFQCVIANNSAQDGGGIYTDDRTYIEASTITSNKASNKGGGIFIGGYGNNNSEMISCILWNNTANGSAQQFGINNNLPFKMTFSAIQGGGALPETDAQYGIINVSSKNVDASKPCVALENVVSFSGAAASPEQLKQIFAQNFGLIAQSACIDKGGDFSNLKIKLPYAIDPITLNADRARDAGLHPRTDGKYDIGAFEYQK